MVGFAKAEFTGARSSAMPLRKIAANLNNEKRARVRAPPQGGKLSAITRVASIRRRDPAHAGERNRHRRCLVFGAWYRGSVRPLLHPGLTNRSDC
jgi:hypothetical protein